MSKNNKRPYADVLPVAQHIVSQLQPFCDRIEIAGSLRRQRPMIGDIEIVALPTRTLNLFRQPTDKPTQLDLFLREKLGPNLGKDGDKYKQFTYGRFQVDLFLPASPDHWACVYLIRTGSHDFNMFIMSYQSRQRRVTFRHGQLFERHSETPLHTPDETAVFDHLHMDFVPPEKRDRNMWLDYVRQP